jgi:S-adenosylmethionine:tRNA ribosyltransferase-isomerase
MQMKVSDFDYNLPPELIAQEQMKPRDHSRLLILERNTGDILHKHFFDVVEFLKTGDVLVMNNSKVFPARLFGKKEKTGGTVEVFLHRFIADKKWQCILGGGGIKEGLVIIINEKLQCVVLKNNLNGTWDLEFNLAHYDMLKIVYEIGVTPLPPYIKRAEKKSEDVERYQTIYADDNKVGSVAAPTAGLHFTKELIDKLKAKGIQFEYITLHVGMGTFAPVKVDNILEHKMHSEYVEIEKSTIDKIKKAKDEKRRIITVGTTSTRALEAFFNNPTSYQLKANSYSSNVDIFIYPGYTFKIVDGLITNFHLPKSTLLMLVSALAGKENIDNAYQIAINEKYRFFSYGDAMLIV